AGQVALAAATSYSRSKETHLDTARVCAAQGVKFQPFVGATTAWSQEASAILLQISRAAARLAEDPSVLHSQRAATLAPSSAGVQIFARMGSLPGPSPSFAFPLAPRPFSCPRDHSGFARRLPLTGWQRPFCGPLRLLSHGSWALGLNKMVMGLEPASKIGILPAERCVRRHLERERDELLAFARALDTELVRVKKECFYTVQAIKKKAAQDLEDFRTGELAKAHADFKRQVEDVQRQRDMLLKEVEVADSLGPHLPTLNPLAGAIQDPSKVCGICSALGGGMQEVPKAAIKKLRLILGLLIMAVAEGTSRVKKGLAAMLKGGVIMDVMNPEQAKIAEEAGACAVMALERIPADIRQSKGVARMSDPKMIKDIVNSVSIPVMAKCRIGHFVEAQVLQQVGVDCIDESEVLTVADEGNHVNKGKFKVPFVCGCRNLGEALRRIAEGASMIRTKGEAGTGDVVEAVRHIRTLHKEMRMVQMMDEDELFTLAKEIGAPVDLLQEVKKTGKLPVVNFAAGGVATPADAALCMQLGVDGVFVGSGIFKSTDPAKRARAIVKAVTHFNDPQVIAEVSEDIGEAMTGINCDGLATRFADREGGNMPAAKKPRMESYGDHKGLAGTSF
ncbi:unnamed protein product, partial [Effrenium voratum]